MVLGGDAVATVTVNIVQVTNDSWQVAFNLSFKLWPEPAAADKWLLVFVTCRQQLLVFSHSGKQKSLYLKSEISRRPYLRPSEQIQQG